MPTLAICRGFQLLNIARGGDLVQHLPEEVCERRAQAGPGVFTQHPVEVKDGTRLASMVGARSDVTSHHHQGIGRVGEGLVEAACAGDGTLEGVEDPTLRVLVGVQWHPRRARTRAVREPRRGGTSLPRGEGERLIRRRSRDGRKRVLDPGNHLHRSVDRVHRRRSSEQGADRSAARSSGSPRCCSYPSSPGSSTGSGGCARAGASRDVTGSRPRARMQGLDGYSEVESVFISTEG